MRNATVLLIMVFVLICFGCAAQVVDDAAISAKVNARLAADGETSAIKIGVDATNGVVTLSGVVPTVREKGKAEQIARNTENVKQVVNSITVNPNSVGATNAGEKAEEAVSDAVILTKIKAKLLTEGIAGTNVDVAKGVVTLKGQVESAQKITQAVDIARSTNGVSSINNQLTARK